MRKQLFSLAVLSLTIPLYACGSGGGSGLAPPQPAPTPQAATRLRTLQAGDSWTYKLTGTATIQGQSVVLGGVRSIQVLQGSLTPGQPGLYLHDVTQVLYPDGHNYTAVRNIYFTQDALTGNIMQIGQQSDNNAPIIATTPGIYWPGKWSINASTASTTRFGGVLSSYRTVSVASRGVTIPTPIGDRPCWEAFVTNVTTAGTTSSDDDIDPALGSFVREQVSLSDPQGITLELTADLAATSVAL